MNTVTKGGVDLERYIKSHDNTCLVTVLNFLDLFKWDDEVERILDHLVKKLDIGTKVHSKKVPGNRLEAPPRTIREKKCKDKEGTVRDEKGEIQELAPPGVVVGLCPKCGGVVKGAPIPNCETKKSGRVFYKECSNCLYYSEIFKKGNKHREVEGG